MSSAITYEDQETDGEEELADAEKVSQPGITE